MYVSSDSQHYPDNPDCIDSDKSFEEQEEPKPQPFSQADLNDLVRDLSLSKQQSELLASRLQERYLLKRDVRITKFRHRSETLQKYFSMENSLCFCNNIQGLFNDLDIAYHPEEWRLFIDASLYSTNAVLLHNTNIYPLHIV